MGGVTVRRSDQVTLLKVVDQLTTEGDIPFFLLLLLFFHSILIAMGSLECMVGLHSLRQFDAVVQVPGSASTTCILSKAFYSVK